MSQPSLDSKSIALLILMFLMLPFSGKCQQEFKTVLYKSFIDGNISGWKNIIDKTPEPLNDTDELYQYTLAYYGYVGHCVRAEKEEQGQEYLEKAMRLADILLKSKPNDPRFFALKGSLYGLQMGLDKGFAPVLGPKALKNINRALDLDSKCPQALIEGGHKDWNAPRLMGGSKKRAISEFKAAIQLMEVDEEFIQNNWFYLNAYVTLARCYEELEMTDDLKRVCQKLLQIEPDMVWPMKKLESLKTG